ncbi:MAG: hypothetical protein IJS94_03375, partial [Clostridia bacterium]|nr:hypothetical protein [Clostridia bacterium]
MGNAQKKVKKFTEQNKKKKTVSRDGDASKFNAILITIASILAVAILVGVIIAVVAGVKSKTADPGEIVSIESDHYKVTNGMVSYFLFSQYYSDLGGQNGVYYVYAYGLDTAKSLKNQTCKITTSSEGNTVTWFDYLLSNTVNSVNNYLLFAEKAYEAGTKLDDHELNHIEEDIDALKKSAEDLGYDYGEYLEFLFGDGIVEKDVRDALELRHLADKQYSLDKELYTYDDEKLESAFNENKNDYQYIDYLSYKISADYPEDKEDTEGRTAAETFARKQAEEIADAQNDDEFFEKVRSYLEKNNESLETPLTEEEIETK